MAMTARLQVATYRQFSTDVGGPERVAWLAALPNRVEELTARWGLDLGEPFDPGRQLLLGRTRDRPGRTRGRAQGGVAAH